ncbi:MAG: glutathione S-transferase family protein [Pseudomonadota bacterium]
MPITLVQFRSGMGVPCPSPFCMKAEILLKLAGLDYAVEIIDDPRKSPKGKLPYIVDNGQDIADSHFIQRHLEQQHGADFHTGLSPQQRAVSHAMARMIEERLYWALVHSRWIDDANWQITGQFWFGQMPPLMRNIVPVIARRQVRAALHGHGLGRHSAADIYRLGAEDIAALAAQLNQQDYMFGDNPTALDATAYPIIANILAPAVSSRLRESALQHPVLSAYTERCTALWFPDFA